MLSAAIAYQVLQQENPQSIEKVKSLLEKHPWYSTQWQARLQDVPVADHGVVLFMQATRWADDIRMKDKAQNRPPWHYVNLLFKPEAQPDSVQTREPEPVNILSALVENERAVHKESDWERRAIALAWLSSEQHCKNLNHTLTSADGLTQSSVERLVRVQLKYLVRSPSPLPSAAQTRLVVCQNERTYGSTIHIH